MRRSREEDERRARLEELKEKIKNPLFRAANEQLAKKLEREIKEQEGEDRIRTYLRDENPGATFAQVVLDTRVDMKVIEQLIADGRIDIKASDKDWDTLENEQKKLLAQLTQTSNMLNKKSEEQQAKQASQAAENAVKGTGMYSKKEKLGKEQNSNHSPK